MPPAKEKDELFVMTTSPNRRVVKAKAPPSAATTDPPCDNPVAEETVENVNEHVSYAMGSPSMERELEQERNDSWKMGRFDTLVAKRKSQRNKELLERRQSSNTKDSNKIDANYHVPPKVLQEFSVEPKHPEHKRSGNDVTGISDGEPQVKRRKASVDKGDDEYEQEGGSSIPKVMVVSALVAAVAVGVAWFRRKAA